MNKGVFKRTMEKVRNHRYIKLIATEARRNYVESESNHHTKKIFSDNSKKNVKNTNTGK